MSSTLTSMQGSEAYKFLDPESFVDGYFLIWLKTIQNTSVMPMELFKKAIPFEQ